MKSLIWKIYVLFVIVLITSCQSAGKLTIGGNQKLLTVSQNFQFCQDTTYFKECVPVFLETNSNSLIKRIDKVMMDDDFLFVFDKSLNSLFIFDKKGKYISKISSVGSGPREYMQLNDVCIDPVNKQIVLGPDYPRKLMFFDYSGNFLSEKSIGSFCEEIVCQGGDFYLLKTFPSKEGEEHCFLTVIDGKTFLDDCFLSLSDIPYSSYYAGGHFLSKGKNEIFFTTRYRNTIYKIANGGIERAYDINFKDENLPDRYRTKKATEEELKEISRANTYVYTILDISEHTNYLTFVTNKTGFYIYDKRTETLNQFNSMMFNQYKFGSSRMQLVENAENTVYFVHNPGQSAAIRDRAREELKRSGLGELPRSEFLSQVKDDDNPIIFLCEFK